MPVPSTIADLTTNEATNYPADSDSVTPTTRPSDYIRAHAAIIKTLGNTVDALDAATQPLDSTLTAISDDSLGAFSLRNRIINGGFLVNQRGNGSYADDAYSLDRWYVLTESGSLTVSQQTDQENGTPYNIRLLQPDLAAKQVGLAQIIEGKNCKDLRGKNATLSLRVRNSNGGQINYAILEWSGTEDTVTSDVISAWAASPTYIASITERAKGTVTPSANTWTDVTALTGAINAATNNLIVFVWSNADFAQNATLDIARVQLEEGSVKTPFEVRSAAIEAAMCQRYFENVDAGWVMNAGANLAGQFCYFQIKRSVPTLTAVSVYESVNVGSVTISPIGHNFARFYTSFNTSGATYFTALYAANSEL